MHAKQIQQILGNGSADSAVKTALATKAVKVMKVVKAMGVSMMAEGKFAKRAVFNGNNDQTYTGLQKSDLMQSKCGRIATRKQHARGKKANAYTKAWAEAVQKARTELGVEGFAEGKKNDDDDESKVQHLLRMYGSDLLPVLQ